MNPTIQVRPGESIQAALDRASELHAPAPYNWVEVGNVGYHPNPIVTLQLAPAPESDPYVLPQPVFFEGREPVIINGSAANPGAYNILADNPLQGFTAQHGAHLILNGFTIRGANYCTCINGLRNGAITVGNVRIGSIPGQAYCAPIGAAGGSQVDIAGILSLFGPGFIAVFSSIENGRIILAPGHTINFENPLDFGIMFNMLYGSTWTQGSPPNFAGAIAGSTGSEYAAHYSSFIGFDHDLIPGSGGSQDWTSKVY